MTTVALDAAPARVRAAWLVPGLVALLATMVAWWASAPYLVGVFHDDGVYLLLGRAIANGEGFHYLHLPGAPAAVRYPPLYSLVLALLTRAAPDFPENLSLFLGLNVVMLGLAALGAFVFLRRQLGWREETAALAALVVTLTTPTLSLAGALLSETLFLAALWPCLLLAERTVSRAGVRQALLTGVAVAVLMLLRTHAVALFGAVALLLVARRRWRDAAVFAISAILPQLPWMIWASRAESSLASPLRGAYGSYAGWLAEGLREGGASLLTSTVRTNLHELWLLFADRVQPGLPGLAGHAALFAATALLIVGMWRLARRTSVTVIFLAAYTAIVLILAYAPWRYAWGVWPLVLLALACGVAELWSRARLRVTRVGVAALTLVPAMAMLRTEVRSYAARSWEQPARDAGAQIAPLVEWVRRNTAPDDVVLSEGEQMVFLYTGRRAAPPESFTALEYSTPRTAAQRVEALGAMLDAVPARYLMSLSPDVVRAARGLPTPHELRELSRAGGGVVFEVRR